MREGQSTYSTTLGRELQDLDEAYKKGLLTEEEYADAKKKLIEQRTK
ncbi:MAG: SHOCT domain-containing protein [Chloroflexota bacterium]